jgi:cold shock CspA family protein
MRFFNNTSYKTLSANDLLSDVVHMFQHVDKTKIESIEMTDTYVRLYGIECVLAEIDTTKPIKCLGSIRWFDESSGEGVIRLDNGVSAWFFSCNVIGANSLYPHLVSNVHFKEGEKIECEMSNDAYMFRELGFTSIRKAS